MTTTVTKVPTSYLTPMGTSGQAAQAKVIWVDNPQALRDLVYGPSRAVPGAVTRHDHGEDGGEVLDGALLALTLGPQSPEGSGTAGTIGIPIPRGSSITGTHKLILSAPLLLPGGVDKINAYALLYHTTVNSFALTGALVCVFAPYDKTNYGYTQYADGTTPYSPLVAYGSWGTWAGTTRTDAVPLIVGGVAGSFSTDALGDPALDREVEVRLFHKPTVQSPPTTRLLGLLFYADRSTTAIRRARSGDLPRAVVQVGDVLGNAGALTPEFSSRVRQVERQAAVSLLGAAPGLAPDGRTPDRRRDYSQTLDRGCHQHQGILTPDGVGGFFADGPAIRADLATGAFPRDFRDDASAIVSDSYAYRGIKIHSAGNLSGTQWLRLKRRVSIGAGWGELHLRFALLAATTDVRTILRAHVGVYPVGQTAGTGGTSIVTNLQCGPHQASGVDSDGYHMVVCDPIPNDAYQLPKLRRDKGKGTFTADALLAGAAVPAGVDTHYAYQISDVVRISLTQPARDSTNTAHTTGDYTLVLRLELQTLDSASYDSGARLNWMQVLSARGW